jgi:RNA polymerase sigma-70 factor (ECF subfamily)
VDRLNDAQDRLDVSRILAGDTALFTELYRRHYPFVHRMGLHILWPSRETDDFEQDVFLNVYQHIGDFAGAGTLHGWIGRIAYNTALNIRRRRIELPVAPEILDRTVTDKTVNNPEQRYVLQETVLFINRAIRELPNLYRYVVHMVCDRNLTYPEISRISGIPVGTLKSQMHRARAVLHHELAHIAVPIRPDSPWTLNDDY